MPGSSLQLSPMLVAAFNTVMSARGITSVYQPVVALADGEVVGYEALARGPSGTVWETPDMLVTYAAGVGRLPELDWICRAAACRGALAAGLPRGVPLFINVEPASSRVPCPPDLRGVIDEASARFEIVSEVTERALARDPAGLLAAIGALRGRSSRIALDDVGADPSSQAFMPLMHPDVIKLDRSIVQHPEDRYSQDVVRVARNQADRTGAVIIAEGIETPEHLGTARSFGATLGQGYLFGRPGSLPRNVAVPHRRLPVLKVSDEEGDTPFTVASRHVAPMTVDRAGVATAIQKLERRAIRTGRPGFLLSTFLEMDGFEEARARYARLAGHRIITVVYAQDMPVDPGSELRGCPLTPHEPLAREWDVVASSHPHTAGVFSRQCTGDPEHFELIATDDRDVVLAAARPLIRRLAPLA